MLTRENGGGNIYLDLARLLFWAARFSSCLPNGRQD
jgi:hypothetical protein